MQLTTLLMPLLIIFVASFIRTAFGFGEALIAVPLLALVMPIEVAAPLAVLVSITISLVVLLLDWREVHYRSAGLLLAATCIGIPLGLWLLLAVSASFVKALLAVCIIAFAVFMLWPRSRPRPRLRDERWSLPFGFVAGILGGAYGMNGPPLVAYGSLRGWSPAVFRATLQGYFLPASLLTLLGYGLAGLWVAQVTQYYLASLPVVVLAIIAGQLAHRRLPPRLFLSGVHVGLILVGLALLWQARAA